MPQHDPVEDYLRAVPASNRTRAAAWDAVYTTDPGERQQRLSALSLPQSVKADLWDLSTGQTPQAREAAEPTRTTADAIRDFSRTTLGALLSPLGRPTAQAVQSGLETAGRYVIENPAQSGAMLAAGLLTSGAAPAAIAIPQAALYGAAGAGTGLVAERLLSKDSAPLDVSESLARMGTEGAVQGVAQGAGSALATGARRSGRWLMNRALNMTERLAQEFPGLPDTMIRRALTVSQGSLRRAKALLAQAKGTANAAVRAADEAGATISVSDVTRGLDSVLDDVAKSADREGGLRALLAVERRLLSGRGKVMTVAEADALKTSLQTESRTLYRQLARGEGRPTVGIEAKAKAAMAAALNDAIEAATRSAGATTYRSGNAAAQELIGATRAIQRGVSRGSRSLARPLVGAALGGLGGGYEGGPGVPAGAIIGLVASHPSNISRASRLLTSPAAQAILRQFPRATAAALQREFSARSSEGRRQSQETTQAQGQRR